MAITSVRKIHILAHRSRQDELMADLQKLGAVEVCPVEAEAGVEAEGAGEKTLELSLRRIDGALRTLKPLFAAVPLREKLYPVRPAYSDEDLDRIAGEFDLEGFLAAFEENERELEELRTALARLEEEKKELALWSYLDAPPSLLKKTGRVEVKAGRLPVARQRALEETIAAAGAHFEKVHEDERHVYAVIFSHRSGADQIEEVLRENAFQHRPLPALEITPAERFAMIDRERIRIGEKIGEHREASRAMARRREELLVMRDLLAGRLERIRAGGMLEFTRKTFSLQGWIAEPRLPQVRSLIEKRYPLASVEDYAPGPHDRVPVILDNPSLVKPFGLVVDLYGLPRYGAVDPSMVLAAFFALFFGLCLTDAGYGILVAALTGGILAFAPRPLPAGRERFFRMFFLCGIATFFVGAAAGGWFGVAAPWRLFDPLENLMFFFLLAFTVGTAHLFTGLILRMLRLARGGDLLGAFADQGLWIALILALFGLGAAHAGAGPEWLRPASRAAAVISCLGIVFFQGRSGEEKDYAVAKRLHNLIWLGVTLAAGAWFLDLGRPVSGLAAAGLVLAELALLRGRFKSILARVGLGLYALYGITGYLSDILSYSRLVALGLATGIIALVVNKMASLVIGMPGIGMVAGAAVLVVGHLFNVAINLLGAFVHSCRLQYVEFFTKFYESGGKAFRPFRFQNRYITIDAAESSLEP